MQDSHSSVSGAPQVPRVLVFFDYACQFCYLDWPRFKRLKQDHDVEMLLIPFELRPQMPEAGLPISEAGGGHSPRVEEYMRHMANEAGLSLVSPAFVPKTHKALTLSEYARDLGPDTHERVHEAIFEAYSGRGDDIGSVDVLIAVAENGGLDSADVRDAIEEGRYDERLHQFRHLALAIGVSATPAALVCNELFIGSRPLRVLQEALERCLVTPETIEAGDAGERPGFGGAHADGTESDAGAPPTLDR